ncbi:hypothetical protein [Streptomyces radicis]|uniref:Uncharacterized protein n=1 Tax=Streptomyces radicis TaxID=1750517 RepID=A0A3A9WE65_9ACTN|nr:hypothetical protein [Streptomyces radicis]RKN11069.1 hypothetical protein D7319_08135 [Streptomyces radicis]RKN25332.1 hypothetical protein D7318_08990 [Streptomyces radicis]
MAKCKKCGEQKPRWPRSCSRCRSEVDRVDVAASAADMAGGLGLIRRAFMGVVRLIQRAFD